MSLLLLAGLAQVADDLTRPRRSTARRWWQRLYKVTLPNMKAAIMVAVLFRALDAFRIFDNVFIMTGGAQNTETVSLLAYRPDHQPRRDRHGLSGVGAAVPLVVLICVVFVKAVQGRPGPGQRGD